MLGGVNLPTPEIPDLDVLRQRATGLWEALPPEVMDLATRFADAGHELALVGGSVRDAFLGRSSADLDFATSASPDQTEKVLRGWTQAIWDMGREFGTIGGKRGDVVAEVTSYRADEYDGKTRKPVVAFGDSLEGDLARRDFTVNAMAVVLPAKEFVDPFGGLPDLAGGLLRTPIEPAVSFGDDPLRMMRGARFASQLGFAIEPATFSAMADMADRISIVSAERLRDELVKLILGAHPRLGLTALVDSGIADHVLPELPALKLEVDEHHRHKDVYEHTLTVLEQAIDLETGPEGPTPAPDLYLRLAALLHDIGKPATRKWEPGGGVSFHHHEVVGAKLTAKRMKALRFDKDTIKAVSHLVGLHLRFHGYGEARWSDSAVRRYVTDAGDQLERLHRLTRADVTTGNRRKAERLSFAYDDLEQRIAELREQEELDSIRPDLDGKQIMEILGMAPGPDVGEAYRHMLEVRMDQGPLEPERARQELLDWWATRSASTAQK